MSVFSGVIPKLTLFKNSNLNSAFGGGLNNLVGTGLDFALNKTLGAELATKFGAAPVGDSNFLKSIVGPGLISTGVQGLNQVVTNSIVNSKALGPFGPLAGNLINQGIGSLGNQLTNSLFGTQKGSLNTSGTPNVYFPGAGGMGESEANFAKGSEGGLLGSILGKKATSQPYSLGNGGPDVVFSIISATDLAAEEARRKTEAQAAGQSGPSSGPLPKNPVTPTGEANGGAAAAPSPTEVPAAAPASPPSPTEVPAAAPNSASAPAAVPPVDQSVRVIQTASGPLYLRGNLADPSFIPGQPSEATPIKATAAASAATQPTGTSAGQPPPASTSTTQANTTKPQPIKSIAETTPGWKFICPPEDISWETTFQADRVQIFGLNDAPVIGGSKSMRELTLNNAIVEGFTRGKTVEDKIKLLEDMMRMKLGQGSGADKSEYVQIPVYKVYANDKSYGFGNSPDEGGFFIIKSVKVQEKLRDLSGRTTRALVDISLTQVPAYQVESGRDIASALLPSQKGYLSTVSDNLKKAFPDLLKGINAANARNSGAGVGAQADRGAGNGGASSPPRATNPRTNNGPGVPNSPLF